MLLESAPTQRLPSAPALTGASRKSLGSDTVPSSESDFHFWSTRSHSGATNRHLGIPSAFFAQDSGVSPCRNTISCGDNAPAARRHRSTARLARDRRAPSLRARRRSRSRIAATYQLPFSPWASPLGSRSSIRPPASSEDYKNAMREAAPCGTSSGAVTAAARPAARRTAAEHQRAEPARATRTAAKAAQETHCRSMRAARATARTRPRARAESAGHDRLAVDAAEQHRASEPGGEREAEERRAIQLCERNRSNAAGSMPKRASTSSGAKMSAIAAAPSTIAVASMKRWTSMQTLREVMSRECTGDSSDRHTREICGYRTIVLENRASR